MRIWKVLPQEEKRFYQCQISGILLHWHMLSATEKRYDLLEWFPKSLSLGKTSHIHDAIWCLIREHLWSKEQPFPTDGLGKYTFHTFTPCSLSYIFLRVHYVQRSRRNMMASLKTPNRSLYCHLMPPLPPASPLSLSLSLHSLNTLCLYQSLCLALVLRRGTQYQSHSKWPDGLS